MNTISEDKNNITIPHVTRYDSMKTGVYACMGMFIAFSLIAATIWLFIGN